LIKEKNPVFTPEIYESLCSLIHDFEWSCSVCTKRGNYDNIKTLSVVFERDVMIRFGVNMDAYEQNIITEANELKEALKQSNKSKPVPATSSTNTSFLTPQQQPIRVNPSPSIHIQHSSPQGGSSSNTVGKDGNNVTEGMLERLLDKQMNRLDVRFKQIEQRISESEGSSRSQSRSSSRDRAEPDPTIHQQNPNINQPNNIANNSDNIDPIEVDLQPQNNPINYSNYQPNHTGQTCNHSGSQAKYKKLMIREFNGSDRLQFANFWADMENYILNKSELTDKEKVDYVVSYLKDDAYQKVETIPRLGENLTMICEILTKSYANTVDSTTYVANRIRLMHDLPANNTKKLERFVDMLRGYTAQLTSKQQNVDLLANTVLNKLPNDWQREILKESSTRSPTMAAIITYLERELTISEGTDQNQRKSQNNGNPNNNPSGQSTSGGGGYQRGFRGGNRGGHRGGFGRGWRGNQGYPNVPDNQGGSTQMFPQQEPDPKTTKKKTRTCGFCLDTNHSTFACELRDKNSLEQLKQLLKTNKRCFKCSADNHQSKDCKSTNVCKNCQQPGHHTTICPKGQNQNDSERKNQTEQNTQLTMITGTVGGVVMGLVKLWIKTLKGDFIKANVLLDSGAKRTCMTWALKKRLRLKTKFNIELNVLGFGQSEGTVIPAKVVDMEIKAQSGDNWRFEIAAVEQIIGMFTVKSVPLKQKQLAHLNELKIINLPPCEDTSACVDILIGEDYLNLLVWPLRLPIHIIGSLTAHFCRFGNYVSGEASLRRLYDNTYKQRRTMCSDLQAVLQAESTETIEERDQIEQLWSLEPLGIKLTDEKLAAEESEALEHFNKTLIRSDDGRYWVQWPYRTGNPYLNSNYSCVFKRFESTLRSLTRDKTNPQGKLDYTNELFRRHLKRGVIEEVPKTFQIKTRLSKVKSTKCGVQLGTASVWDPCGLVSPVTLPAKLLIQDIGKLKQQCDIELEGELKINWEMIWKEFELIRDLTFNRYVDMGNTLSWELVCFTNSSAKAMGVAIYLIGDHKAQLICGKSKVVQTTSTLTIPNLELTAVTLGVITVRFVQSQLSQTYKFEKMHIFSDSKITLTRILNGKTLHSSNKAEWIRSSQNRISYSTTSTQSSIRQIYRHGELLYLS
jgi:hypothetical protein